MQENFASKSIDALAVVPQREDELLLAVVDGMLVVYELPSFFVKSQVEKTRGAYLIAHNMQDPPQGGGGGGTTSLTSSQTPGGIVDDWKLLQVAVALRNKSLLILQWDGKSRFMVLESLQLPDMLRTIEWADDGLVVGFKKEYNLISLKKSGDISDIFPVGRKAPPTSTLLPNRCLLPSCVAFSHPSCFSSAFSFPCMQLHTSSAVLNVGCFPLFPPPWGCATWNREILLGSDDEGICIGYDGKPTRKEGFQWTAPPSSLCYCHPFVVAALPHIIEVRQKPYLLSWLGGGRQCVLACCLVACL